MNKIGILITGGNFINKGAEAMVLSMADAIKKKFQNNCVIYVAVEDEYAKEVYDNFLRPYRIYPTIINLVIRYFVNFRINAVIDVGGYQFADSWGERKINNAFKSFKKWKKAGKKVFYMPQAWGPLTNTKIQISVREILRKCDYAFARDDISLEEIRRLDIGEMANIGNADDVAWNFEGHLPSEGEKFIRMKGVTKGLVVGITPNMRVYEKYETKGGVNRYIVYISLMIEWLLENYENMSIVLLGHEFNRIGLVKHDDRFLNRIILDQVATKERIFVVDDELSARTIKAIICNFDLIISSRYHAIIAALSQGVPAIALGWSHKYDTLMHLFELDDCIVRMEDEKYKETISWVLSNRVDYRKRILECLPKIKSCSCESIEVVLRKISDSIPVQM